MDKLTGYVTDKWRQSSKMQRFCLGLPLAVVLGFLIGGFVQYGFYSAYAQAHGAVRGVLSDTLTEMQACDDAGGEWVKTGWFARGCDTQISRP